VASATGVSRGLAALAASGAYLVPLVLSRSTSPTPDHPRILAWYKRLRQPAFKPPDAVIPIAWTGIESALALAAYRLLRRPAAPARNRALAWLAFNVFNIGGWSRLFFGRRNLPASTVAAAAMIGAGAAYVAEARKADPASAVAGVPFVAWVAFATVLTAAIWQRNR
jgi:tryptophan-rich sensory protein